MKTSDFFYDLPEELIAQTPSQVRGQDKLLVMDKLTGKVEHHKMEDLIDEYNLYIKTTKINDYMKKIYKEFSNEGNL